jgi:hypothetical protein
MLKKLTAVDETQKAKKRGVELPPLFPSYYYLVLKTSGTTEYLAFSGK